MLPRPRPQTHTDTQREEHTKQPIKRAYQGAYRFYGLSMKVSCHSAPSLFVFPSLCHSLSVSAAVFFAPLSGKFGALHRDLRAFKMIRKLSYDLHDSTSPKQWQLIKNNFRNLSIVLSPSPSSSVGDNRKVCMKSISTWATMGHFCAPNRSHLSGFLLTCPMRRLPTLSQTVRNLCTAAIEGNLEASFMRLASLYSSHSILMRLF